MTNLVVHFEVIGRDRKKLQDFYAEVFHWKINTDNPIQYGMISAEGGEGIGGGVSGYEGEDGYRGVTFYVQVANIEEALRQIEAAGGKTLVPPADVPGGPRMAQFTDPEGNRIGLIQAGTMQGGRQA